jgi:hypothetical protein
MGITIFEPLWKKYKLDKLLKENDYVDVSFKIISGEAKFRSYCCIYAKDNGFAVSVKKEDGYFKVIRTN